MIFRWTYSMHGLMSVGYCTGTMLDQLLFAVPELRAFANLKLEIPFNVDSSRVGPAEWVKLARLIHDNRENYDAFLIVHGTDTMAYTAAALSFMLAGFRKPIVLTGRPQCYLSYSPCWMGCLASSFLTS